MTNRSVGQGDDTEIRNALHETFGATPTVGGPDLERSIERRVRQRARRRHATRGAAALAVVTAIVAAVLAVGTTRDQEAKVTTGPPETSTDMAPASFAPLGPGWHEIDTGPVPASDYTTMAWTGAELVVSTGRETFAYDPTTAEWRALGALPFDDQQQGEVVWTGEHVVAVSRGSEDGGAEAAVLHPGDGTGWTEISGPETAPGLEAAGSLGPGAPGWGGLSLLWTGQRVIDVTHGAVLDPDGWTWSTLPYPDNLLSFFHLISTNAVWDGSEVVAVAASSNAGLAWDPTGSRYREVPGIPDALLPSTGTNFPTVAISPAANEVVVVSAAPTSAEGDTNSWRLDTASGAWSKLPASQVMNEMEGCPSNGAAVAGRPVIPGCERGSDLYELVDGVWSGTGQPTGLPWIGGGTWHPADDALVIWASSTDTANDPTAPYTEVWVWVPPTG